VTQVLMEAAVCLLGQFCRACMTNTGEHSW